MRAWFAAASLALLVLPGAANADPEGEAKLAKMLHGRVAGKPVACLSTRLASSVVIDGTAIVYRNGSTLYVNRPRTGAAELDNDDILIVNQASSQLCSIDKIDLIDRGSRLWRGFVVLDSFVPYTLPRSN